MRYQKIEMKIWNDKRFNSLSMEAQLLFFYLLTSPHSNIVGMYVLKEGYAMEDVKVKFKKCIEELEEKGMVMRDSQTGLTLIVNFFKYNSFQNQAQLFSAVERITAMPYVDALYKKLYEVLDEIPENDKGTTRQLMAPLGDIISKYSLKAGEEFKPHEPSKKEQKEKEKIFYGKFVKLHPTLEYEALIAEFGKPCTEDFIKRLNIYIGAKRKHYASHYYTILQWIEKDKREGKFQYPEENKSGKPLTGRDKLKQL